MIARSKSCLSSSEVLFFFVVPFSQFSETRIMSSKLQAAMENLVLVFHAYSEKEGDKYKLSKQELKNLLRGELGEILPVSPAFTCTRGTVKSG